MTIEQRMRLRFEALYLVEWYLQPCGELATPYPLPYGFCDLEAGHEDDHHATLGWPYHPMIGYWWPRKENGGGDRC